MPELILFAAVSYFMVRGAFLGFPAVVARAMGYSLAYFVAYSYRERAFTYIKSNFDLQLPTIVIQIASSLLLFFVTLLTVRLLVHGFFKLLAKVLPSLETLLDSHSKSSRVIGAFGNGSIAAVLVLLGIWGYDQVRGSTDNESQIHQFAGTVGNSVSKFISANSNFTLPKLPNLSDPFVRSVNTPTVNSSTKPSPTRTTNGSATIVSVRDPNKRLSIESIGEALPDKLKTLDPQLSELLEGSDNSDAFQKITQNPQLQEFILKQLKDRPEDISKILEGLNIED